MKGHFSGQKRWSHKRGSTVKSKVERHGWREIKIETCYLTFSLTDHIPKKFAKKYPNSLADIIFKEQILCSSSEEV